jgi:hypothetical protein
MGVSPESFSRLSMGARNESPGCVTPPVGIVQQFTSDRDNIGVTGLTAAVREVGGVSRIRKQPSGIDGHSFAGGLIFSPSLFDLHHQFPGGVIGRGRARDNGTRGCPRGLVQFRPTPSSGRVCGFLRLFVHILLAGRWVDGLWAAAGGRRVG